MTIGPAGHAARICWSVSLAAPTTHLQSDLQGRVDAHKQRLDAEVQSSLLAASMTTQAGGWTHQHPAIVAMHTLRRAGEMQTHAGIETAPPHQRHSDSAAETTMSDMIVGGKQEARTRRAIAARALGMPALPHRAGIGIDTTPTSDTALHNHRPTDTHRSLVVLLQRRAGLKQNRAADVARRRQHGRTRRAARGVGSASRSRCANRHAIDLHAGSWMAAKRSGRPSGEMRGASAGGRPSHADPGHPRVSVARTRRSADRCYRASLHLAVRRSRSRTARAERRRRSCAVCVAADGRPCVLARATAKAAVTMIALHRP